MSKLLSGYWWDIGDSHLFLSSIIGDCHRFSSGTPRLHHYNLELSILSPDAPPPPLQAIVRQPRWRAVTDDV